MSTVTVSVELFLGGLVDNGGGQLVCRDVCQRVGAGGGALELGRGSFQVTGLGSALIILGAGGK